VRSRVPQEFAWGSAAEGKPRDAVRHRRRRSLTHTIENRIGNGQHPTHIAAPRGSTNSARHLTIVSNGKLGATRLCPLPGESTPGKLGEKATDAINGSAETSPVATAVANSRQTASQPVVGPLPGTVDREG
jgi:hypothetical protein